MRVYPTGGNGCLHVKFHEAVANWHSRGYVRQSQVRTQLFCLGDLTNEQYSEK